MHASSFLPPQPELVEPFASQLSATVDLERCARLLDLEDWIIERLRHPEQETSLNFLLPRDDASAHPVTALWVRHCSAAGPALVPLKISREAFLNGTRAEAMRMTWLAALYGLENGGGAAALIVDPRAHSEKEMRRAMHSLAGAMHETAASASLIFPSDAHPVEMDWLDSAWAELSTTRPVISGKASSAGTLRAEEDIAIGLAELVRCAAGKLSELRVAVQGFDPSMQALMRRLHHAGARIVATADMSGGVQHPLGLDPILLSSYVHEQGVLLGYPSAEEVLNADVLAADCDVLILAAGESQISSVNVSSIRARVILEVPAKAISEPAKAQLTSAGKLIVGDLLCAGPALLTSISERDRSLNGPRLHASIRRAIRATWREVTAAASRWNISCSHAAQTLAIQRVATILRAQGI